MISQVPDEMLDAVAKKIESIESEAATEVVVVLRHSSGDYLDLAHGTGAGFALLWIVFALFSPLHFSESSVLAGTLAIYLCGHMLVRYVPANCRTLARNKRMEETVMNCAKETFHTKGVAETRDREGMLILASRLEKKVVVIPDRGLAAAVPPDAWAEATTPVIQSLQSSPLGQPFLDALDHLREVLARHTPAKPDREDELTNRPFV